MRTVDALVAARNFFHYSPTRWTRASLAKHSEATGTTCFCALGGIAKVTGCLTEGGTRHHGVQVSCVSGPIGVGGTRFSDLSRVTLNELRNNGIELAAAVGAVKYLAAACKQLYGVDSVITVNDTYGYEFIMKAFDLAIKNARRRHITGDRKKSTNNGQEVSL